jgi:hypothetical protein
VHGEITGSTPGTETRCTPPIPTHQKKMTTLALKNNLATIQTKNLKPNQTIIMVDTVAKESKKKLNIPTPFTGKREDLRKFLQEVKIYLLANGDVYPTDLDKVLFVISYMNEGDVNSWKEEFFDTAEPTLEPTTT